MFPHKLGIRSKNIILMYIIELCGGLLFFLPVIALYIENDLFSVTNVAIIFAVQSIAMAIFEIPTGAVADLFGRKNTLILAYVMVLVGLVFLYIGGSMYIFILYALFNAFARSLESGTNSALIYDTLKEEGKEIHFKKVIGTYFAVWPFGAIIGSLIGGYLASVSLSLPVLMAFIPLITCLLLSFFLKEPKYEKEKHKNIFKHMIDTSKIVIKDSQLIILFIAGFLVWGLSESMHELNSLFFAFKEIPIIYFGVISAFVFGFSSIGHYFSDRISEKIGNKTTLIVSSLGSAVFMLAAVMTTKYVSAVLWIIPSVFFGLRNPVIQDMINLEVSSSRRATLLSSYSFIIRIGLALFSPLIGYFADIYTINASFKISAVLLFTVPIIYMFLKKR